MDLVLILKDNWRREAVRCKERKMYVYVKLEKKSSVPNKVSGVQ